MVDNILEVCRVLLNSNSFLRFLEKILTIGNMMNAAIKKTCEFQSSNIIEYSRLD